MLGIEAALVGAEWVALGHSRVEQRSRSDPVSVPLLPPLANADRFLTIGIVSGSQLGARQPNGLRQKAKQQKSREKLGLSEAFAREIWTHKVEPSVLPCRRRFGESSAMSELEVKTNSGPSAAPATSPAGPEFAVVHQPSYARTVFLGPEGLRAGWGITFYLAMFLPLQKLAVELAWSRNLGPSGLWSMMLEEFCNLAAAVIPALVLVGV